MFLYLREVLEGLMLVQQFFFNTLTSIQGFYKVFGSIPVDRLPGAIKGPLRLLDTICGVRPPLWVYGPLP